jgi:hypothetical protein
MMRPDYYYAFTDIYYYGTLFFVKRLMLYLEEETHRQIITNSATYFNFVLTNYYLIVVR